MYTSKFRSKSRVLRKFILFVCSFIIVAINSALFAAEDDQDRKSEKPAISQEKELDPDYLGEGQYHMHFGQSVGIYGNFIVGGVPLFDYNNGTSFVTNAGEVRLFYRDEGGAGNWGMLKQIKLGSISNTGDYFGHSVDIDNSQFIAGAYGEDKAYIFEKNYPEADDWGRRKILSGSDTGDGDLFGYDVAIDGDIAVVGAHGHNADKGAAYVFYRDQGGSDNWGQVKKLQPDTHLCRR
jgi:hypothetical protein